MAAMTEVESTALMSNALANIPSEVRAQYVASIVWLLYDRYQNDELFTVRLWFITKTFRVADTRSLLERWFGPHPVTT